MLGRGQFFRQLSPSMEFEMLSGMTDNQHRPGALEPASRTWGLVGLAVLISFYLLSLPSSQALEAPLLPATLEAWDESEPAEDKTLLLLPDHQPDLGGVFLATEASFPPGRRAAVGPLAAAIAVSWSSSEARAPPVV